MDNIKVKLTLHVELADVLAVAELVAPPVLRLHVTYGNGEKMFKMVNQKSKIKVRCIHYKKV